MVFWNRLAVMHIAENFEIEYIHTYWETTINASYRHLLFDLLPLPAKPYNYVPFYALIPYFYGRRHTKPPGFTTTKKWVPGRNLIALKVDSRFIFRADFKSDEFFKVCWPPPPFGPSKTLKIPGFFVKSPGFLRDFRHFSKTERRIYVPKLMPFQI